MAWWELQGKGPEAKQAGMFGNCLALSTFQKVLLSHPVWEQSLRTSLLQVALGLHRMDLLAPGPHGCHSSVARLVHLWSHETMLWFGAFH